MLNMNICHFCGNKNFKTRNIQYTYKRDGKYIVVDDIPCEQYFEASVIKNIEEEFDAVHIKRKKA